MRARTVISAIGALAALAAAAPADAPAQAEWRERANARYVWLEVSRVSLRAPSQLASAYAAYVGARLRLGDWGAAVLELPFAYGTYDSVPYGYRAGTSFNFGNPYVGLRFATPWPGLAAEMGIRPHLTGEDLNGIYSPEQTVSPAAAAGASADVDRNGAFQPAWTVIGRVLGRMPLGPHLTVQARAGLTVVTEAWAPGMPRDGTGFELAFGADYEGGGWRLTAGLMGVVPSGESFSDGPAQATASIGRTGGGVEPSLLVRVPLRRYWPASAVVGVGLIVPMR